MAINFPNSPSVNDIHVEGANRWQWNGTSWTRIGGVSSDADVINSANDNSTTTLYPVMVSGTGSQTAKIATSATKNLKFDASEGDLTVGGNISVGGTATFTGSVSVGGTITYEDVRNVDSIGIVTARAGVIVTGNVDTDTLNVSGISTVTGGIKIGTAGTICEAGNMTLDKPGAGIITATRFVGSGVSLTDVISGVGIRTAGGTVGWAATIIDFRGPGVTTAYYSSVTGVGTVYFQGGGGGASVSISESAPNSPGAGDLWWDSDVGNLQIYYTDANSSQWVTANNSGPQGPQGAQGAQGHQGVQGAQGRQGAAGAQGAQGHQGVQGAQGHQGRQGSVGIASLTISTGAPSSPAQGDMWWDSDDANLSIYYNDGNSSQWVNINAGPSGAQGAPGAQGAQGRQGAQGAQGATGAAGAQGAQGHQGVQGAANATTINSNTNNYLITGTGTANTLQGESKLTFDGDKFTQNIVNTGQGMRVTAVGDHWTSYYGASRRTNANTWVSLLGGRWQDGSGTDKDIAWIGFITGDDTTNKDNGELGFYTSASAGNPVERVRITSAGRLGIGVAAPDGLLHVYAGNSGGSSAVANGVTIENSGTATLQFLSPANAGNQIRFGDNGDNGAGWIQYVHTDNRLDIGTNGSEKLRITSGGHVNIGGNYTQTTDKLQVDGTIRGNILKANASIYADANASTSLFLHSTGTTGDGRIFFGDASTFQAGKIVYNHNGDYMYFGTGGSGTERLRITSDGHTLFSGLTSNIDTRNGTGISVKSPGGITFRNFGANGSRNWRIRPDDNHGWSDLEFGCAPTDGANDIPDHASDVVLALEGDTRDVTVANGNLKIGTSGKGIDFAATANSSGSMSNELLDDYEEGSWTPTPDNLTNTPQYYNRVGNYTKIGNLVYAIGFLQFGGSPAPQFSSTGSHLTVSGLPFPCDAGTGYVGCVGAVTYQSMNWSGSPYNDYSATSKVIAGANSSSKTTFRVDGTNNTIRGTLKREAWHGSSCIITWEVIYRTNS